MFSNPTFWVGVGFTLFLGLLGYMGVFKTLMSSLDQRADKIKTDLDQAERLRKDAEALLKTYKTKQKEAEKEAAEIVKAAEDEAARITKEAEVKLKELVERSTKAAEQKIAMAEADAFAQVKSAATQAAVAAAESILTERFSGKGGQEGLKVALGKIKENLH